LVSGDYSGNIQLWDVRQRKAIGELRPGHEKKVSAVAFGTVNRRAVVVSASKDCNIRLWDARTGHAIGMSLEGHTRAVTAVALAAVGARSVIVSGSDDNTIRLWDARTGLEWFAVTLGSRIEIVDYLPGIGIVVGLATGMLVLELKDVEGGPT
jgi:WD40 repeat protein